MLMENTKENRIIQQVAASLAIEDMYVNDDFITTMISVGKNEKTTEEVIEALREEYER